VRRLPPQRGRGTTPPPQEGRKRPAATLTHPRRGEKTTKRGRPEGHRDSRHWPPSGPHHQQERGFGYPTNRYKDRYGRMADSAATTITPATQGCDSGKAARLPRTQAHRKPPVQLEDPTSGSEESKTFDCNFIVVVIVSDL
jgi:hypothetical protein